MLLAEEFLLLCLDDASGRKRLPSTSLDPALGGALLVELALAERISVTPKEAGITKRGRVQLISTVPTDDAELDAVLDHLGRHEGQKVSALISDMSGKRITKKLSERLLERLVRAGVLSEERSAVLGIRSWPVRDTGPEQGVRQRLQAALIAGDPPTEQTVALISLLHATGLLPKVVTTEGTRADKAALKNRAKTLSEGDWAANGVRDAIAEVAAVSTVAVTVAVSSSS